MNKQQLQQEIAELQKQLEEKQKALAAMPDKWEPKGGGFWIDSYGELIKCDSNDKSRLFGMEYITREQAEKAAKAIAGAVASYKAKGGGKGPTSKQKARG